MLVPLTERDLRVFARHVEGQDVGEDLIRFVDHGFAYRDLNGIHVTVEGLAALEAWRRLDESMEFGGGLTMKFGHLVPSTAKRSTLPEHEQRDLRRTCHLDLPRRV